MTYIVLALLPMALGLAAALVGAVLSAWVDARARRPVDAPPEDGWALALDRELEAPTARPGGRLRVRHDAVPLTPRRRPGRHAPRKLHATCRRSPLHVACHTKCGVSGVFSKTVPAS